jgi:hypothetical protein
VSHNRMPSPAIQVIRAIAQSDAQTPFEELKDLLVINAL